MNIKKMLGALLVIGCACACASTTDGIAHALPFRVIERGEYANFVKNWDDKQVPLRAALIQSRAHYDAYFAPAAVMGRQAPYAPDPAVFDTDNILLVSRVVVAPLGKTVFEAERVVEKNSTLEFHYRFTAPRSNASFTVKESLSVRIPKGTYTRVKFIENGETASELSVEPVR